MRFLLRVLIALVVVVAVLAAASFLLPREIAVARDITINAPPSAVFPHVNNLKKFEEWSPWAKIDPNVTFEYTGPEQGVGQKVSWSSDMPDVGTGSQEIVESVENQRVRTALDFGDHGTANAVFKLEPSGDEATKVVWGFTTDSGYNPMMRWMGLMMDKWVGEKYDEGLGNLKKMVEGAGS